MTEDHSNDPLKERARQAKVVRRVVLIVLGIIIFIVIVLGAGGYWYINSALKPVDESSEETKEVEIPIGSNVSAIGSILERNGIIKNGTIFRYYVTYKNENGLQAGKYELSPSMTIEEIIQSLKEGKVMKEAEITFTIPEGTWLEDIIAEIADSTSYAKEDIEEHLSDEDYLNELIKEYNILDDVIVDNDSIRYPLEGYLFPARYDFYEEDPGIKAVIEKMIERMESNMVEFSEQVEAMEYSIHEILTLASIVEREAQNQEDRPIIAGVLYNRLEKGMRLEVDPTVAYALGEHRYMTSFEDLEVDSPYNTYANTGLPPGPIASPGIESIKAVLEPDNNDYLYFYARPNGEVIYNEDFDEHQVVQDKYRHEWQEGQEE